MPRRNLRIIKFWRWLRSVFSSERVMDILVFFGALVVAMGFWVLQRLNDTFEMEVKVPLSLTGVPRGVTLTTPLPSSVRVTLRDRGTQLMNYMRHRMRPVTLEFSLYDDGGATGRGFVPIADVQHAINAQILTSTVIQRITPDTLEFFYNRGLHRRLPVRLLGTAEATERNYLHSITFSPDSVIVYAPALVLDTMTHAYTEETHISNIEEDYVDNLHLRPMRGVKYEPDVVQMKARVDYYTESIRSHCRRQLPGRQSAACLPCSGGCHCACRGDELQQHLCRRLCADGFLRRPYQSPRRPFSP